MLVHKPNILEQLAFYKKRVKLLILTFFLTIGLVAIDQITKYLATQFLLPVGNAPFIPYVVELQYVLNDGAAFSLFSGNRFLLIGVTSVALLVLAGYLIIKKPENKFEYCAWVLVLAGGIGNLIDRVINGVVVDFFSFLFVDFAVFNVADIYVTCGVALLIITITYGEYALYKAKKNQLQTTDNTILSTDQNNEETQNEGNTDERN